MGSRIYSLSSIAPFMQKDGYRMQRRWDRRLPLSCEDRYCASLHRNQTARILLFMQMDKNEGDEYGSDPTFGSRATATRSRANLAV